MKVEVTRYRKPDGYATRYWAVLVDGDLLAVTVYRKGAESVARALNPSNQSSHVQDHALTENNSTGQLDASPGVAAGQPR